MTTLTMLTLILASAVLWTEESKAQSNVLDDAIVRIAASRGGSVEHGTGFVMSSDGVVATAYHVIDSASRIDVYFRGRQPAFDVIVAAIRPQADLALLRIPLDRVAGFYPVGARAPAGAPGDTLLVHGHPLGFPRQTITGKRTQSGYLRSNLWTDDTQKSIFAVPSVDLLPIDVTSEPGLSGSPVVDAGGRVVAVFSGSLRRGGGYAWAVPVDYIHMADMQMLERRAGAVQWPRIAFVNPGISLLRARPTSDVAQDVGERCRTDVNAFSETWHRYYIAQVKLGTKLGPLAPTIASSRQRLTPANAAQMKNRVGAMWQFVSSDMESVATSWDAASSSLGGLLSTCFGESVHRLMPVPSTPATYNNMLASMRFGRQLEELALRIKTSANKQRANREKFEPLFEQMLDAGGAANNESATEYELVRGLLDILVVADQLRRAPDEASHAASVISNGLLMAELHQRLAIHEWETEHRAHDLDTGSLRLRLVDGWLPFDTHLRAATLKPGVTLPASWEGVYFGTIKEDDTPSAFAETGVERLSDAAPSADAPDDQLMRLWSLLDAAVANVTRREGLRMTAVNRTRTKVGRDIVLEATGSAWLPSGREVGVYVGLRFQGARAAKIHCYLAKPPWNEYRLCTSLTANVVFSRQRP